MTVEQIMTRDPAFCLKETGLQDVARLMVECDCGEIPVVDHASSRKPIGVVTDRDITCRAVAEGRNPLELRAGDVMSTPAVTVTPETTLEECAATFEDHQIRRVPVVDAQGRLCGIVAQADLAQHASPREVGEVVREVSQPAPTAGRF